MKLPVDTIGLLVLAFLVALALRWWMHHAAMMGPML